MDFDDILAQAGGNVRSRDDETYRPEIVNVLLAEPEAITGLTITDMLWPAWPESRFMEVAAKLSRKPWARMVEDIKTCLIAEGFYWRDTPSGRRWFPAEYDSSAWAEFPDPADLTGGSAAFPSTPSK